MESLKNKIVDLYSQYQEFEKIVKEKNKLISEKGNSIQELIKDKSLEDLENLLVHVYVDTILYNKDLQILFFKLITNIETYVEFSKEDLPKDILDFYNNMKSWSPKRIFMIEKEDLVETETGTLAKAREEFLESDFFKGLVQQTTK
jgi:hypothetical protein